MQGLMTFVAAVPPMSIEAADEADRSPPFNNLTHNVILFTATTSTAIDYSDHASLTTSAKTL